MTRTFAQDPDHPAASPGPAPEVVPGVAILAHELNNALTVILGGLALTGRRLAGDAAMTRLIDNMRLAAERASSQVRELQMLTGINAGFPPGSALAGDEPLSMAGGIRRRRILVVEDDPDVAEVAMAVLEGLGHQVELAGTAPDALTRLREEAYDLVFSDVVMPGGMTGVELAEAMGSAYPSIPVLLATGYSAAAVGPAASRFPLMAKPYSVRELSSRVAQLLGDA